MSSNNTNIYNKEYDTYNELVSNVLEERNLSQSWLLKNIIEKDQKKASLQSQISRWFSDKKIANGEAQPVGFDYRKKINNALNIDVKKNSRGKWEVSRTSNDEDIYKNLETDEGRAIFERIKKYLASNTEEEPDSQTRTILLSFRDQLKSQQAQTHSMIQILNMVLDDHE